MKELVDHMDYGIQVRTDKLDDEYSVNRERSVYRRQMENRVGYCQHALRMIHYALLKDINQAKYHFEVILYQYFDSSTHVALTDDVVGYLQWNQGLALKPIILHHNHSPHIDSSRNSSSGSSSSSSSSSSTGNQIARHPNVRIKDSFASLMKLCLSFLATNPSVLLSPNTSSSSSSSSFIGFISIVEVTRGLREALHCLFDLRQLLLSEEDYIYATHSSDVYTSDGTAATTITNAAVADVDCQKSSSSSSSSCSSSSSSNGQLIKIISPDWLKLVVYFQRTIGTCFPLLLQACINACSGSTILLTSSISKMNTSTMVEEHVSNIVSSYNTLSAVDLLRLHMLVLTETYLQFLGKMSLSYTV